MSVLLNCGRLSQPAMTLQIVIDQKSREQERKVGDRIAERFLRDGVAVGEVDAQRVREAYKDTPVVVGGIEASLRRIAHFDYWSEKVRRSALLDAKADLLVYGNAERQICEIAHRLAAGQPIRDIQDLRGTAFVRRGTPGGWIEIDSTTVDTPAPSSTVLTWKPQSSANPRSASSA